MKTTVQIIATQRRESVYEGGRKSVSYTCQTIVFGETIEVGVLRISEKVAEPFVNKETGELPVGYYELEYGLAVSFKDRSVGGQLKSIAPVAGPKSNPIGVAPSALQAPTNNQREPLKA